jgi:hypothetical protein
MDNLPAPVLTKAKPGKAPGRSWSDHDLNTLKTMWSSGAYSSDIAKVLGRTRNAIMGRVHRLKLVRKGNADLQAAVANRPQRPGTKAKQALGIALLAQAKTLDTATGSKPTPAKKPAPETSQQVPDVAPVEVDTVKVEPVQVTPVKIAAPVIANPAPPRPKATPAPIRAARPEADSRPIVLRPPVPRTPDPVVETTDVRAQVLSTTKAGKIKRSLESLKQPKGIPLKPIVCDWLKENYPNEHEFHDEMLVIVIGALTNDITPISLAQNASLHLPDAAGVRVAMLQAGIWNKDAGNLERYDGPEGWLQLVLEAMLVRGLLRHIEGKWYLPEEAPKGKSW